MFPWQRRDVTWWSMWIVLDLSQYCRIIPLSVYWRILSDGRKSTAATFLHWCVQLYSQYISVVKIIYCRGASQFGHSVNSNVIFCLRNLTLQFLVYIDLPLFLLYFLIIEFILMPSVHFHVSHDSLEWGLLALRFFLPSVWSALS